MKKMPMLSAVASIFSTQATHLNKKWKRIDRPINFKKFHLMTFIRDVQEFAPLKGVYIRPNKARG